MATPLLQGWTKSVGRISLVAMMSGPDPRWVVRQWWLSYAVMIGIVLAVIVVLGVLVGVVAPLLGYSVTFGTCLLGAGVFAAGWVVLAVLSALFAPWGVQQVHDENARRRYNAEVGE